MILFINGTSAPRPDLYLAVTVGYWQPCLEIEAYALLLGMRKRSRPERCQAETVISSEFLQNSRRTANALLRKLKLEPGDVIFLVEEAHRRKDWCAVIGTSGGAGAVRHHANRAGSGFSSIRVR